MIEREQDWALWLRAAIAGDSGAYHHFLTAVTPFLRAATRRALARTAAGNADLEDVVQEILLAVHLKRHTWDPQRPIGPWLAAITRNKVIDALRRTGGRSEVPIDLLAGSLAAVPEPDGLEQRDVARLFSRLNERQRAIVQSISLEGTSVRHTAERLHMSEGAVRVALHRALKMLASYYRGDLP